MAACAGMFVFGIVLAVLGALFPEIRDRLHVDLARQGDVFLMLYFGIFVSTLFVGPVIDSFGNKFVLVLSAALVTVALVGFSFAASFIAAVASAFLLGLGGGGLNTASNALVADLYADNRGAMLNVLGIFFGFGALFIPLLAASILGVVSASQLLLTAAALSGVCASAYALLPFPPPSEAIGFSLFASLKAAGYPGVMWFGLLLFFESGNESSIGGWTSTYVGSVGAPARTATWILTGYWAALMVGRIIGAKALTWISKERLVLISGIGSAIGCAVLLSSRSVAVMLTGGMIVGLSFAAIYPTTLAIAADRYERLAGTIFGLLFAIGLIGGMSFPWAVGQVSELYSVRAGMLIPVAGAVMIAIIAVRVSVLARTSAPDVSAASMRVDGR
jgi:FHS family glucose/mannose:H+ symporter-like MFS transporter